MFGNIQVRTITYLKIVEQSSDFHVAKFQNKINTSKYEEDRHRHEKYLVESHHPQDISGLILNKTDEKSSSPPGILT
jgi:hypothetical protein